MFLVLLKINNSFFFYKGMAFMPKMWELRIECDDCILALVGRCGS